MVTDWYDYIVDKLRNNNDLHNTVVLYDVQPRNDYAETIQQGKNHGCRNLKDGWIVKQTCAIACA